MENPAWPRFLDLLDTDPDTAWEDFYRFTISLFKFKPPIPMRGLCKEDQEDLIERIIDHCIEDNFRVLRQYVSKGKHFTAWLYAIAHNFTLDYLRRKGREPETVSVHKESNHEDLIDILPNPGPRPDTIFQIKEILANVQKMLTKVGEYCRLLIEMSADGLTPKEMAIVLRLSNKKVSDDLRYCREKLVRRLAETGIDYFLD